MAEGVGPDSASDVKSGLLKAKGSASTGRVDRGSSYAPLVSIIVVNFNYGAHLRSAVLSALAQTYPYTECIVVDDQSTDDSRDVIRFLAAEHSQIKVVLNEKNLGQSGSMIRGLDVSSGHYCIFLDADDVLLPACVATHVHAHLSLRDHVGLTSGDMLQIFRDEVVTIGSPAGFSSQVSTSDRPRTKPVSWQAIDDSWSMPSDVTDGLVDDLYYVPPEQAGGWPWSPTSGNCFRRDALELVIHNDDLASLRLAADCYLLRGISCLTGSVLIDRPLAGYRLHEKNEFKKTGMLNRFIHFDPAALVEQSNFAMRMLIRFLVSEAPNLVKVMACGSYFCDALDALDHVYPPIEPERTNVFTNQHLLNDRTRLVGALGAEQFIAWLAKRQATQRCEEWPILRPFSGLIRRVQAARLKADFKREGILPSTK